VCDGREKGVSGKKRAYYRRIRQIQGSKEGREGGRE
jgi:hypothetical protein